MTTLTTPPERGTSDHFRSTVDMALDRIRGAIESGRYTPGDRLKERELAEELRMSRVPVREALRSLATEGFVTLSPRRGAVVTTLEPRDLEEIFDVRQALEVQECLLAVRNASAAEADRLIAIAESADDAAMRGQRDAVESKNAEFHDALVEMSHNHTLTRLLEPLRNRLHWVLRQNDDTVQLRAEHRELADFIAARDVTKVHDLAMAHVRTSKAIAFKQLFGITLR